VRTLAPSDEGAVAQRLRERIPGGFRLRRKKAENWTFSLPPPFGHLPHQREASASEAFLCQQRCPNVEGRLRHAPRRGENGFPGGQWPPLHFQLVGGNTARLPANPSVRRCRGGHWPPAAAAPSTSLSMVGRAGGYYSICHTAFPQCGSAIKNCSLVCEMEERISRS